MTQAKKNPTGEALDTARATLEAAKLAHQAAVDALEAKRQAVAQAAAREQELDQTHARTCSDDDWTALQHHRLDVLARARAELSGMESINTVGTLRAAVDDAQRAVDEADLAYNDTIKPKWVDAIATSQARAELLIDLVSALVGLADELDADAAAWLATAKRERDLVRALGGHMPDPEAIDHQRYSKIDRQDGTTLRQLMHHAAKQAGLGADQLKRAIELIARPPHGFNTDEDFVGMLTLGPVEHARRQDQAAADRRKAEADEAAKVQAIIEKADQDALRRAILAEYDCVDKAVRKALRAAGTTENEAPHVRTGVIWHSRIPEFEQKWADRYGQAFDREKERGATPAEVKP